ncbi:MAG: fasciclin domain-containing protein [Cyanobacteria bacterium P01_D01_bin.1]
MHNLNGKSSSFGPVAGAAALSLLATLTGTAKAEAPVASPELTPAEPALSAPAADAIPAISEMPTIAEIADGSENFNILATALEAAELFDVLNSAGPFTVFAPTDEAFSALPAEAIEALLLPENKESLVELLTYHVVPGAFFSADLETGNIATVEGSFVTIGADETEANGAISVDSAQIVDADVVASNGVIHAIDRVIIPPVDLAE